MPTSATPRPASSLTRVTPSSGCRARRTGDPENPSQSWTSFGSAVVTLTGYSPDDARLARAVDRARDDVQALHDDLAADATLTGDGQIGRTAMAALSALDDACA